MSARQKLALAFAAGMVTAGALNTLRWSIWPISGGPQLGMNGPMIFGWLGGHPYSFHVPTISVSIPPVR